MAKSQETFSKKEKEKKRRKKRQDKLERREQRKLEKAERGKRTFEEMITYVDEFGNFTDTPPDPSKRMKIKAEDIMLGVPPRDHTPIETTRRGIVKFFNHDKGYGFITDTNTKESIFVHINNVGHEIAENDRVIFEVEKGPKGLNAVNVSLAPKEVPVAKKEEEKKEAEKKEEEKKEEKKEEEKKEDGDSSTPAE